MRMMPGALAQVTASTMLMPDGPKVVMMTT